MDGEGRLRRRGGPVGAADIGWRSSLWFCHDPRMTGITAGGAELDAALNRFVTRNGRRARRRVSFTATSSPGWAGPGLLRWARR